jgi:hypothetical protein
MRVQAVRLGYYDLKRRREGEIFELHDPKHFSDCNRPKVEKDGKVYPSGWMRKLDEEGNAPSPKKSSKKKLQNQDVI